MRPERGGAPHARRDRTCWSSPQRALAESFFSCVRRVRGRSHAGVRQRLGRRRGAIAQGLSYRGGWDMEECQPAPDQGNRCLQSGESLLGRQVGASTAEASGALHQNQLSLAYIAVAAGGTVARLGARSVAGRRSLAKRTARVGAHLRRRAPQSHGAWRHAATRHAGRLRERGTFSLN